MVGTSGQGSRSWSMNEFSEESIESIYGHHVLIVPHHPLGDVSLMGLVDYFYFLR